MAASFSLLAACVAAALALPTEVTTEYGRIQGRDEIDPGVVAFYGIPFASPPEKDLRFKSPVQPNTWTNVRDCSHDSYFHICPQFHTEKKVMIGSEDCLYLNVYVPRTTPPPEGFPVMFWIYGGGYVIGDGYEFGFYRGKYLAALKDVIIVEHNYRLGVLGLLSLPELKAEGNTTGNFALLDQQYALQFVARNIAQFSGNPNKITIFGEIAGAFSVCWHLVSPVSSKLISAAIMESGTCSSPDFFFSLNRSYTFGLETAAAIGCNQSSGADRLTCMRGKSWRDMFVEKWPDGASIPPLAPAMPYGPAIDGTALVGFPIDLIEAGRWARVPLIIGTNLNEGSAFIPMIKRVVPDSHLPLQPNDFPLVLSHFFNDTTVPSIESFYPAEAYQSTDTRAADMLRDYFFFCASRRVGLALSKQNVSVYLYQFTQKLDNWVDYLALGDYHTLELPFVFHHQWPPLLHAFGPNEEKLSNTFNTYWTNLAKHGDPNYQLDGEIIWPAFNTTAQINIFLEHPTRIGAHLWSDVCDFWSSRYEKYYFQ